MKKLYVSLLLIASLFYINSLWGQVETSGISIFKNGKSFLVKKGTVNTENSSFIFDDDLPSALYGSLWFEGKNIEYIKSYQDTVKNKTIDHASHFLQSIIPNTGKRCKVFLKDDQVLSGKFEPVHLDPAKKQINPNLLNSILLQFVTDNNNWVQFRESQIQYLTFLEEPNSYYPSLEWKVKNILEVGFKGADKQQNLSMFYLSNGMSWYPFYLLKLNDEDKAKLIMNAEITNELEDVSDIDLQLVIGQPNLGQANGLTPLVNFGNDLIRIDDFIPAAQSYQNTRGYSMGIYEEELAIPPPYENELISSANEDFHLFKIPHFSLPKGGRSQLKVFSTDLEIEHFYKLQIEKNAARTYYYEQDPQEQLKKKIISQHYIRTINTSANPWTTAPVFIVKNDQNKLSPVSQDIITYAPAGSQCEIKVAESPDIFIEHKEKVISTAKNDLLYNKQSFNKLEIQGTIIIYNYPKTERKVEISRVITGMPVSSEQDWKLSKSFPEGPNETHYVKWIIDTKAKQKTEFHYTYYIYTN